MGDPGLWNCSRSPEISIGLTRSDFTGFHVVSGKCLSHYIQEKDVFHGFFLKNTITWGDSDFSSA